MLLISSTGSVFDATLTANFTYDKSMDAIGFVGALDRLEIPAALTSIGVNAKSLSSAGLVLLAVRVRYATVPIPSLELDKGDVCISEDAGDG